MLHNKKEICRMGSYVFSIPVVECLFSKLDIITVLAARQVNRQWYEASKKIDIFFEALRALYFELGIYNNHENITVLFTILSKTAEINMRIGYQILLQQHLKYKPKNIKNYLKADRSVLSPDIHWNLQFVCDYFILNI